MATDLEHDFKWAKVKLQKTDKSKNGYYVWINDVPVLTAGPVVVEQKPNSARVTLTLAVLDLVQE